MAISTIGLASLCVSVALGWFEKRQRISGAPARLEGAPACAPSGVRVRSRPGRHGRADHWLLAHACARRGAD
eukprot:1362750-Alexandrium_andersonii.AAC.1